PECCRKALSIQEEFDLQFRVRHVAELELAARGQLRCLHDVFVVREDGQGIVGIWLIDSCIGKNLAEYPDLAVLTRNDQIQFPALRVKQQVPVHTAVIRMVSSRSAPVETMLIGVSR